MWCVCVNDTTVWYIFSYGYETGCFIFVFICHEILHLCVCEGERANECPCGNTYVDRCESYLLAFVCF